MTTHAIRADATSNNKSTTRLKRSLAQVSVWKMSNIRLEMLLPLPSNRTVQHYKSC